MVDDKQLERKNDEKETGIFYMKMMLISSVVFSLLGGCNQGKELPNDTARIKETVIQYNKLLSEGYRNLNMTPLLQVATKERGQKAYHHMAALGEARIKMDANLRSITFSDIKLKSVDKSEIKTVEEWDYTHINIDSENIESQNSTAYELTYTIVKINDKWVVSDIKIEKEE
jgi:hypothetical protein